MSTTLKERHETKRVIDLRKRLTESNARRMSENKQITLFLEAMDKQDLQKAQAVMQKLDKLQSLNINSLNSVIARVRMNLSKELGDDSLVGGFMRKLKNIVGIKNPLVKAMTFASALETGFGQFGQIINNTVGPINSEHAKLTIDQLLDKMDADSGESNKEERQKALTQGFIKALKPQGFFAQFSDNIPEFSTETMMVFINELLNGATLGDVNNAAKFMKGGASATDLGDEFKNSAMAQAPGVGPGEPQPSAETGGETPTAGTDRGEPTSATGTAPAAQGRGKIAADDVTRLTAMAHELEKTTNISPKDTLIILGALAKAGRLSEAVKKGLVKVMVDKRGLKRLIDD